MVSRLFCINNLRRSTVALAALATVSWCCSAANAGTYFQLGGSDYSNTTTGIVVADNAVDVAITDLDLSKNLVQVALTFHKGVTGIPDTAKIDKLSLNIVNPSTAPLTNGGTISLATPVASVGDPALNITSVTFQADDTTQDLGADGSKGWDILVNFDSNAASAIYAGDTYTFVLTGTGLSAASFLEMNGWQDFDKKTGKYVAGDTGTVTSYASVHIQALAGDKSGWYGNTYSLPPVDPNVGSVPEPTSLAVWGLLSLVGVGYGRRRKVA